jgi:hypothetical protein
MRRHVSTLVLILGLVPSTPPAASPADPIATLRAAVGNPRLPEDQRRVLSRLLERRENAAAPAPEATAGLPASRSLAARPAPGTTSAGSPIWSPFLSLPLRTGHTLVTDHVGRQLVLFGGGSEQGLSDDVWSAPLDSPFVWRVLAPAGARPVPRMGHTAVFDPLTRRMLVFGGLDSNGAYLGDLWTLSLSGVPAWDEVVGAGAGPGGRANHSAVLDSAGRRMLVHAGDDGSLSGLADVWELSLAPTPAWSAIAAGGILPPASTLHSAAWDPDRQLMVVAGGSELNNYPVDATRALYLGGSPTWGTLGYYGPSGSSRPQLFFDRAAGAVRALSSPYGDWRQLWQMVNLYGTLQWTASPVDSIQNSPSPRRAPAAWDPVGRGLWTACGDYNGVYRSDAWKLSLGTVKIWTELLASPGIVFNHAAVWDPAGNRMLVIGGMADTASTYGTQTLPTNQVWSLSLGDHPEWSRFPAAGGPMLGRDRHVAMLDAAQNDVYVFGGERNGVWTNELWRLDLDSSPTWSRVVPAGTLPPRMTSPVALFEPVARRVWAIANPPGNDLWSYDVDGTHAWSHYDTPGPVPNPYTYSQPVSAVDPVHRRILLLFTPNPGYPSPELWALSLDPPLAWTRVWVTPDTTVLDAPAALFVDPLRDRLILVGRMGRYVAPYSFELLGDLWAFPLSGPWVPEALEWSGAPGLSTNSGASWVFDAAHDRALRFGGSTYYYAVPPGAIGTWALSFASPPLGVPPERSPGAGAFALRFAPSPATRRLTVRFTLSSGAPAHLDLYDAAGRRLVTREIAAGPGPRFEDFGPAAGFAPGIYLARIEQDGRYAVVRTAVIR